ncbi:signal peptidase I [Corynebacterium yudongzhengii]|uniref:Signal peptidase I n=1 Tax=Corynebacterium yudongzhengii TaxID=2080740 RepID=A0A2U1T690_9CORY|nr:signal peptidase I [Corynebacterium yudongzhengii]AWB81681.1 signal peptidase I [Corynebacterium yudongzhengii]PWC01516.1 signal peptidase I [Corynebacterium yudongzhengii]
MTTSHAASDDRRETTEKKVLPWYLEFPIIILVTLAIMAVLNVFIGRVYMIPSASMEPTLHGCAGCTGDRIAVEKVSYYFTDPEPGDVVVFEGTDSWNAGFTTQRSDNPVIRGLQNVGSYVGLLAPDENNLVKRIIAEGGQTVSCQAGDPSIMVDGQPTDQSYVLNPPALPVNEKTGSAECGGDYFGPIEVPEGHYFMMGDNRTNSLDSRAHIGDEYQGTIPEENIRGKVQAVILPLSRIGNIENPDIQPQQA